VTLILKNIRKAYGKRAVVDGVNLSVSPGQIVGLLGPNGAGKTTIFSIATGAIKPDEGTVWLYDREIAALSMEQRSRLGIGYLPQQASIFRHLSVSDNLRLVLEHSGIRGEERHKRLRSLLWEFGLERVANVRGNSISGGERRRTELARALAVGDEPKFLLLDEQFAGVDPIAVSELQNLVARLQERQLGILITDHNVRETLAIVDRAYILRDGQILASGTASQLSQDPLVRQYYLGDDFRL